MCDKLEDTIFWKSYSIFKTNFWGEYIIIFLL